MSQSKIISATPVVECQNTLGEGPLWHSQHQMLYWVDIEQKVLHGFEPHTQRHRKWVLQRRIGTVVRALNGNLIIGLQGEVAQFDPRTGEVKTLLELEPNLPENRCNDGKCDPVGRLWVGTMQLDTKPKMGSLYCIDKNLQIQTVISGLTIANGMGWSPEGDSMYFIDSADYSVRRYSFSRGTTILQNEKVILRFENELPDGMCVDTKGMLWIGFWGGSRVGCYDPATGRHLLDVEVPAPHVTSCCFGGKDLRTLFITTARQGLSDEQLGRFPLSGSLFSCTPGGQGLEAHTFGVREKE